MPIRFGREEKPGFVAAVALALGVVVTAAAAGTPAQPPAPAFSAGRGGELADQLRRAAGSGDWSAVDSGLDAVEQHLEQPEPTRRRQIEQVRRVRVEHRRRDHERTWEERWDRFGERMGARGERFGERMDHRGEAWGEHWGRFGERMGEHWGELGERAGERWGRFGERTGERWAELGERAGRRWSRFDNELGHRFEETADDVPTVIELSIETVLDAFDTLLDSLDDD